jgi:cephalosporin hydroxylase
MIHPGRRLAISLGALALLGGACFYVWRKVVPRWLDARAPDAFHLRYHREGAHTFNNTYWLGVPVQKTPPDLWIYQEILNEIRPDLIVETGTYKGGSAYYLASICDLLHHGEVATVDIVEYPDRPKHDRIRYLLGSSVAPDIVAQFRKLAAGKQTVMVSLDSNHTMEHVLNELRLYSGLVTKGSYLVVEDTHFNGHPILPNAGPGPMEAVDAFLRENHDFAIDREREKFLLTFNPRGYLRRVR